MFDIWIRDTEITSLIIISAIFIIIPLQLFLCFKTKRLIIKLLPAVLLALTTSLFAVMMLTSKSWEAIGYAVFAVFSGVLLFSSGLAWLIFAIIKIIKKLTKNNGGKI